MSPRGRWLLPALVLLGTGVLGVAVERTVPRNASLARPVVAATYVGTLRLMTALGPSYAGEMLALRAGLFEREGLTMELRPDSDGDGPIATVAGGADMFGIARADSFLLARGRGAPIVAFAAHYIESPVVLYALGKSGVRTPGDFIGRRVGRRLGDDTSVVYDALTAKLSLPVSKIVEVPVSADLSMLVRGDVDVWPGHIAEEDYQLARLGVEDTVISPASYGIHFPGSVYFASERTMADKPQLVRRFFKSVVSGWELAYADYAHSVPLVASFDSERLTPDYIRFVLDRQREFLRPIAVRLGEYDDGQWRTLQDILVAERRLDRPVDLSSAIDYDVLRDVYRGSSRNPD